jgi:WD40 repeat protein
LWNGREPGEIKVWDLTHGQEIVTIRDHPTCVFGVAYSPDGKTLASCSKDGTVRVRGELARRWRERSP